MLVNVVVKARTADQFNLGNQNGNPHGTRGRCSRCPEVEVHRRAWAENVAAAKAGKLAVE